MEYTREELIARRNTLKDKITSYTSDIAALELVRARAVEKLDKVRGMIELLDAKTTNTPLEDV